MIHQMDGWTLQLGGKQYHQTATPADILRMIESLGVLLAHHLGLELVNLVDFLTFVKHCLGFSFVFSAPLPAWRNLFSLRGIFCGGRYQLGCTGIS
jgi:hypothetical protein